MHAPAKPTPRATTAATNNTRLVSHTLAASSARLLSTGFRMTKEGNSQIVMQTSTEVTLEQRATSDGSVFVVKNCRVQRSNDRRPLDTRFFDSPVTGVTLKEHGGDLEINVALRASATATPHKEPGPGNTWYWILDVPGTRRASAPGKTPTAGATP
ncbi:MAG TPA: AMIN domain-containing protein [Polyangia bacterium]|nr:AMIN domain-containing protein [Polyangia bacterium]